MTKSELSERNSVSLSMTTHTNLNGYSNYMYPMVLVLQDLQHNLKKKMLLSKTILMFSMDKGMLRSGMKDMSMLKNFWDSEN